MVSAKKLCYVAVLTALNVVLASFSVPTPVGAHIYLTDAAIIFAGLVLDPVSAFIVGGVGAFIGDAIFYPVAMFVSLFTHGLQAVAVSLIAGGIRKFSDGQEGKDGFKNKFVPAWWRVVLAGVAGCVIMAGGYALGNAYVYGGGWGVALPKILFELLQSGVGAVLAPILAYKTPLKKLFFVNDKKKAVAEEQTAEANGKESAGK
ncbi:MAG: ECF transporter S component [Candidatus Borkfalkiaceae bacterium]|nr:ECF transporter S component [Clostridia bacterium]MDY6223717.1 ECF transporter S component [Christensenellaceae bacterium]